jgi:hypothetical protein
MATTIDATAFGSITINGERYDYDVLIRCSGEIKKRKKKLSKRVYGSSHVLSRDEAEHVYEDSLATLIIGTGQHGALKLSGEADVFFREKGVKVILQKTPQAVATFNQRESQTAGLFHITC